MNVFIDDEILCDTGHKEESIKEKLSDQLNELRKHKHSEYKRFQAIDELDANHKWPKKTLLCISDSIMNQLDERRLSRFHNVKVRAFSESNINDMLQEKGAALQIIQYLPILYIVYNYTLYTVYCV